MSKLTHLKLAKSFIHSASHHASGTIMREGNLDLAAHHVVEWWITLTPAEQFFVRLAPEKWAYV